MALSGSFTGSTSNGSVQPKITWSATQSVSGNYSDVTATLTYSRTNSGYTTSGTFSGSITINGTTTTGSKYIEVTYNSNTVALTATTRVYHNVDGTKTITISCAGAIPPSSVTSTSCSSTITLDAIPRAAQITTASHFTDEDNPYIIYTNPAESAVTSLQACISWTGGADIAYRDVPRTKNATYEFPLTEAERNKMRAAVVGSNSMEVTFYLKTVIGGNTFYSTSKKNFSILFGEPVLDPSVLDISNSAIKLTGNDKTMIKYYNSMDCQAGAEGRKGATIVSQSVTCGGVTKTGEVVNFTNATSNVFTFSATDNRGNTVTQDITVPIIHYVPLTCNVDAKITLNETDGTKADISFTVSGYCYKGSFGAKNNTISLFYRVEDEDGNLIDQDIMSVPDSAITLSAYEVEINLAESVDYKKSYIVYVDIADSIIALSVESNTLRAVPVFDWSNTDFNFNVPVSFNGTPMADFIVEQGTEGAWYYRKWNSGIAECWTNTSGALTYSGIVGSFYVSYGTLYFPFTFVIKPVVTYSCYVSNGIDLCGKIGNYENRFNFYVASNQNISSQGSCSIFAHAIGRWK